MGSGPEAPALPRYPGDSAPLALGTLERLTRPWKSVTREPWVWAVGPGSRSPEQRAHMRGLEGEGLSPPHQHLGAHCGLWTGTATPKRARGVRKDGEGCGCLE